MGNVIRQTNRTMLMEVINPGKLDLATLIGDVRGVESLFCSSSLADSNARATDFGLTAKVWGKMLYKLGGEGSDATLGLAKWSQVPSEKADCYRSAEITAVWRQA